jgi:hypothetical protein
MSVSVRKTEEFDKSVCDELIKRIEATHVKQPRCWKDVSPDMILCIEELLRLKLIATYVDSFQRSGKTGPELFTALLYHGMSVEWMADRIIRCTTFCYDYDNTMLRRFRDVLAGGFIPAGHDSLPTNSIGACFSAWQIKCLEDMLFENATYFTRVNELTERFASGAQLLRAMLLRDVSIDDLIEQLQRLIIDQETTRATLVQINQLTTSANRPPIPITISTLRAVAPNRPRMFTRKKRPDLIADVQRMVDASIETFAVVSVKQIENATLAALYEANREHMKALGDYSPLSLRPTCENAEFNAIMGVDPAINEVFLFHGCQPETQKLIATNGFDERFSATNVLFGPGTYFADELDKSLEYTKVNVGDWFEVFLARVCIGCPEIVLRARDYSTVESARAQPLPNNNKRFYDSRFYPCPRAMPTDNHGFMRRESDQTPGHNEFICFKAQTHAYPEFVLRIKRIV